MNLDLALLFIGIVILVCIFFSKISLKTGIPMLLLFIVLGMICTGVLKIPFNDFQIANNISSTALIFIMFYGGFMTNWHEAKPVAKQSIILASAGVILTAGFTGLFCFLVLRMDVKESFLIASVISSTDAASVFSILRSRKLNLKDNTSSLLEVESGSNDPTAYMLVVLTLAIVNGELNAWNIILLFVLQVVLGVGFGALISYVATLIFKKIKFNSSGIQAIFLIIVAILAYAVPQVAHGNGYLSAYIVGIVLGNLKFDNKRFLVQFFDGISLLFQMILFFLLGMLSTPEKLFGVFFIALAINAFMILIARPLATMAILTPFKSKFGQQFLVSWTGLRGASGIVFAIFAVVGADILKNDVYHIVFCVVLISISLQGSLLPFFSRKLKMINEEENVLKLFNDYVDENEVQFISLEIAENHPWIEKSIKDINLIPDTLLVLIIRGEEKLIPRGNLVLHENDVMVLSAPGYIDEHTVELSQEIISLNHEWIGKSLSELEFDENSLVVLIKRKDKAIIPNGKTIIHKDDVVIIHTAG